MSKLLKDLMPVLLLILGYIVVLMITILLVQVCYNHSIVTLTKDPITKNPRLQEMQFLQAFAFIVLVSLLFPSNILSHLKNKNKN